MPPFFSIDKTWAGKTWADKTSFVSSVRSLDLLHE